MKAKVLKMSSLVQNTVLTAYRPTNGEIESLNAGEVKHQAFHLLRWV
jgi:hypothetical protein